jgi:ureidoglycolate lyase
MLATTPETSRFAVPLDAATFAPFGTVIAAPAGVGRKINDATSDRFDIVDDLQLTAAGGRPQLALFRSQARRFPFIATELECHRLGSQSFVPLTGARFVIVVAPAAPAPHTGDVRAFVADGRQGVVLHPGTWHHALLTVDDGDFVVIERAAAQPDCDIALLEPALTIVLDPARR